MNQSDDENNSEEKILSSQINIQDSTISNRIKFIKKILLKCGLDPMIDFDIVQNNNKDNNDTNNFYYFNGCEHNDIRNIFNKRNHDLVTPSPD